MKIKGKKILIIDDEPSVGMLLQFNLRQAGFEVYTSDNPTDGMEIAEKKEIDLFILDISIPGMSGIDICKLLRQIPKYKKTPIVMISSKSDEETIEAANKAGASHYITKPFVFHEFAKKIATFILESQ